MNTTAHTKRKNWKYRMEAGMVTTIVGKIWIPEAKRRKMIKETYKMLGHAGADKVLDYIGSAYDMAKMKDVVKARRSMPYEQGSYDSEEEETVELTAREPFEKIYIDIC